MKIWTLMLLRVSLGWLLVIWGADKVFNVEHSMAVANKFYFGLLAAESALQVAGVLQMLIGLAVVVGFARRWVYPVQALFNAASLFAVLQSVIDPWGWVFTGSNVLFYPSLIIFAASLLLIAYRDEDKLVLGKY
jgi:putative oxidoreductase